MALALSGYASVLGSLGDYPAALAALNEAMAIGEALGDNAVISAALINLAIVYSATGDYERSLDTNRRSLALTKDGDRQGRSTTAWASATRGKGSSVPHSTRMTRRSASCQFPPADVPSTLTNIGNVYSSQGNLELSLDYYSKALALIVASGGGESPGALSLHTNLGIVMVELGRLDAALESFLSAGGRSATS